MAPAKPARDTRAQAAGGGTNELDFAHSPRSSRYGRKWRSNETGRKIYLTELFRRLRERLDYPPREASLELRDIVREQIYHLARVIEGKQLDYEPFIPG